MKLDQKTYGILNYLFYPLLFEVTLVDKAEHIFQMILVRKITNKSWSKETLMASLDQAIETSGWKSAEWWVAKDATYSEADIKVFLKTIREMLYKLEF